MTEPDIFPRALLGPLGPYAGRAVVVGVSGGADSVALLRALLLVGARPHVAHLDHRLREDSGVDAAWVEALAARLGVPCSVGAADVALVARRRGWNLEAAGRRLRYDLLARTARAAGAGVILTAHTRDDDAETVLFRVLRGEAVLTGVAARLGRVERPWLGVTRAELRDFLGYIGQGWREDPSNADRRFTRNWLRHEVLPLLRSRFPDVDAALVRLGRFAGEDDAALRALAEVVPPHATLGREPPAVTRRVVAARLASAGLPAHAGHVETLAHALRGGGTRHVTLPGGRDVTVTGGALHLGAEEHLPPDFPVPPHLTLRHRLRGDRVRLPGGTRRLSDVLSDRHVPRGERDRLWVLAHGQDVRWVGTDPPVWAEGAPGELGRAGSAPWHDEMGEALALARRAAAEGEVPVGAVVVHEGQIVARAHNRSGALGDMTAHAELLALRAAAETLGTPYLVDCTLVVTLEPCPMCYGAAVEARVGRVVFGADNPKLGALGGVTDLSRAAWGHRPEVLRGVRAGEAGRVLREFFVRRRGGSDDAPPSDPPAS